MGPNLEPPDNDHHEECEDSGQDECICQELEDHHERYRQNPNVYDTWAEWELAQPDREEFADD